ncbi:MAG: hypothetical protein WBQ18_20365 [Solirubrobacteraceae bacterium]
MSGRSVIRPPYFLRHPATMIAAGLITLAVAACGSSSATHTTGPGASSTPSTTSSTTTSTTTTSTTTTSATPSATAHGLTVAPAVGSAHADLHFTFTPAATSGGPTRGGMSFSLSVSGPQRAGCIGAHGVGVPVTQTGRPVTVTLGPTQLGAPWCTGTYTARVVQFQRPLCQPGTMCPQFIRLVATLGPVRFRITG